MRINRLISIILLVFLSLGTVSMSSSATTVRAKLDSTIIMMGKLTDLKVEVIQEKNVKGRFPIFDRIGERGYVGVCGDSIELRAPSKIDTIDKNGRLNISYTIPIQGFDSGYYKLPELQFVTNRDTTFSNSVVLKVVPVLANANDPIDDYANVSDPENPSIFDIVPDWMINYWWIILIVLILLATIAYIYYRYKKDGTILKKKPIPTPYEVAYRSLIDLKSRKLWEQGEEKEYYTDLTDILRVYLYGRFGLNAMEMTSRQIMSRLRNVEEAKDQRKYLRKILDMADFVKFAKVRPLPEDNIESMDFALKFIEETKPVPVVEDESKAESDSKEGNSDNKSKVRKGGKE